MTLEKLVDQLFFDEELRAVNDYKSSQKIFNFLCGYCLKLDSIPTDKVLEITSPKSIVLHLEPSNNKFMQERNPETSIRVEQIGNGTYMHSTFELIYSQQDDLIHAGKLCVEENKAYETCIEGAFSDQLVSAYGCLPPWWPKENNITCEKDLPVKQVSDKALEKISTDLDNI